MFGPGIFGSCSCEYYEDKYRLTIANFDLCMICCKHNPSVCAIVHNTYKNTDIVCVPDCELYDFEQNE